LTKCEFRGAIASATYAANVVTCTFVPSVPYAFIAAKVDVFYVKVDDPSDPPSNWDQIPRYYINNHESSLIKMRNYIATDRRVSFAGGNLYTVYDEEPFTLAGSLLANPTMNYISVCGQNAYRCEVDAALSSPGETVCRLPAIATEDT